MSESAKPVVTVDDARRFLDTHHGRRVDNLEAFGTGHWSAAFGYEVEGDRLVARFGRNREWYEVDQAAHAYDADGLPVPRVREIGEVGNGVVFAISERKEGVFLEDVGAADAPRLRSVVDRLLSSLKDAPLIETPDYTWRAWLEGGLDPNGRNAPWRRLVAQEPVVGPIGARADARLAELLDEVPEKRELFHGDLVHKNVLVAPDLSRITAVFSWKCSGRGDALFDLAWLTFWAPWYPGIAALDLRPSDEDARLHQIYEIHIGATHLNWYGQIDDKVNLYKVAGELERRLDDC